MKKLLSKIWATKEEEKTISEPANTCAWSFEQNGWEASARRYNQKHNLRLDEV